MWMDFIFRAPRATIRRTPHCTTLDNIAAISHDKHLQIEEILQKEQGPCCQSVVVCIQSSTQSIQIFHA
jgi:hypothetical protein